MDRRHLNRVKKIQLLFALSFAGVSKEEILKKNPKLKDLVDNLKMIDETIQKYAPRYPLIKIAKIDLTVLRLSVYELLFERKNPPKVVIDEAVVLAKEFGTEKSYAFINGVLGSILKSGVFI
ncbi:transcription antitermination factor NusB [Candidatus Roizmanbacteria bacterium]|nr:transcription antitermination factor NusB [Candidatus Roizmanbacteria bacterium]